MPLPVPVPKAQLVSDFIASLGWDATQESGYPLLHGPEIIDMPDQAVFITPTSGPGFATEEGGLDRWGFQARLRGPSDDPDTPAAMIEMLDYLILTAGYPAQVDGVTIAMVARSGASPAALPLDPQSRRFEYTCSYIITSQTGA